MKNGIVISGDDAMIEIIYKGNIYYCIIDKEDISKVSWIKGTWHMCVNRSGHIDGVKYKLDTSENKYGCITTYYVRIILIIL